MAEIVRKIGKITKYETKSYVGKQKILDLDRASEEGVPAAEPVSPSASRTPAAEPTTRSSLPSVPPSAGVIHESIGKPRSRCERHRADHHQHPGE